VGKLRVTAQNQRLKNLAKIFIPFGLLWVLHRAFYPICSGKPAFMFDLKPHLQLPGGYTFRQKKKLPRCSTLENPKLPFPTKASLKFLDVVFYLTPLVMKFDYLGSFFFPVCGSSMIKGSICDSIIEASTSRV
jgi:hypothetical protein